MVFAGGVGAILLLTLWVYVIIDIISSEETAVRNLPKIVWLVLVVLVPLVGAIAWLAVGRPEGASVRPGGSGGSSTYRPRHPPAPRRAAAVGPEDSPEFLRRLDEQRRLREWEDELRRREEELRRDEQGGEPGDDATR